MKIEYRDTPLGRIPVMVGVDVDAEADATMSAPALDVDLAGPVSDPLMERLVSHVRGAFGWASHRRGAENDPAVVAARREAMALMDDVDAIVDRAYEDLRARLANRTRPTATATASAAPANGDAIDAEFTVVESTMEKETSDDRDA